uniref:Uncharacterized protein n=1 Tax=Panagrolaimus sp. ES5 TaxID=591445 RepID=A0AC34G3P9_9BILA
MEYIFENVKPSHLIKLYRTAKFFFYKYGLNIIQHLEIVDDRFGVHEIFTQTKTVVGFTNPYLSLFNNFWISDSFIYRHGTVLSPFYKCTIKKLESITSLSWEEFEMLTREKTIEELKITSVYDDDGEFAIEDILPEVPNAKYIKQVFVFKKF